MPACRSHVVAFADIMMLKRPQLMRDASFAGREEEEAQKRAEEKEQAKRTPRAMSAATHIVLSASAARVPRFLR